MRSSRAELIAIDLKSINNDIETFRAVAFAGVESALGRFDGKLTAVELLLFNELGKNNLELVS